MRNREIIDMKRMGYSFEEMCHICFKDPELIKSWETIGFENDRLRWHKNECLMPFFLEYPSPYFFGIATFHSNFGFGLLKVRLVSEFNTLFSITLNKHVHQKNNEKLKIVEQCYYYNDDLKLYKIDGDICFSERVESQGIFTGYYLPKFMLFEDKYARITNE